MNAAAAPTTEIEAITEEFVTVDPRTLVDAEWGNIRKSRDPEKNNELRVSMERRGKLLQPVVARRLDDNSLELLAGYGRRDNAIALEWASIPCNVVLANDDEALAIMLDENKAREDLNPADEAVSAALYVSRYDGDYKLAAEHLGWPVSLIRQRITLRQCVDEVLESLRKNLIDVGHAVILSQLTDEKQRQKLPEIVEKRISVKDLKEWSKSLQIPLSYAKFDKTECETCPHNSTIQSDLFSNSMGAGQCSKSECFQAKQKGWGQSRKAELEEEFGTVLTMVEKPEKDRTTVSIDTVGDTQFSACRQCSKNVAVMDTRLSTIGTVFENQCIDLKCNAERVAEHKGEPMADQNLIATDAAAPAPAKKASQAKSETKTTGKATTKGKEKTGTVAHSTPKVLNAYADLHRTSASKAIAANLATDSLIRAVAVHGVARLLSVSLGKEVLESLQVSEAVKKALGQVGDDTVIKALCLCSVKELSEAQIRLTLLALEGGKYTHDAGEKYAYKFHKQVNEHAADQYTDAYKANLIAAWVPSKETLGIYTKAALEAVLTKPGIDGAVFSEVYTAAKGEKAFAKLMSMKTDDRIDAICKFTEFSWDTYAPVEYIEKAGLPV
jgi:PRTRC genetic system ParB family protein